MTADFGGYNETKGANMNDKALAIRDREDLSIMDLGTILARSGFFQDTKDAGQAIVKVLAGRELGFGPIASMTGVYIVKGKVALSANLMAAAIKRSGRYNYRVRKMTDSACEIVFFEGKEEIGVSTFTLEDAKAAGLSGDNWRKFPRNMLFARAISNGAKWYCPDLSGGPLYTPDELGAIIDGETGEVTNVIDVPPAPWVLRGDAEVSIEAPSPTPPQTPSGAFSSPLAAAKWGFDQGCFKAMQHAQNAYDKLKAEKSPKDATEMAELWRADIRRRVAGEPEAQEPELDERAEVERHYIEMVDRAHAAGIDTGYPDPAWTLDELRASLAALTANVRAVEDDVHA